MRTVTQATCPICASAGTTLYTELADGLYGAPGEWRLVRCSASNCGALWLDPAPLADDLSEAYANYYTHSVSSDDPVGFRTNVRDAFAARVLGYETAHTIGARLASWLYITSPRRSEWALYKRFYLPWKSGGRLLEIGCGSGAQLALMARLGWDATGLDFDPRAIAAARSRGLNVSAGDVRSMAYSAASFDAIVMTHVIEHVVDPVGLLKECRRILKPQGTLVLVTPNPSSLGHRIYGRAWRGLEPPRHLVIFPPEALRLACAKAGIGVSRIIFSPRDAANLFLSSERLSHVRPHEQIRRPDSSATPPLRLRILENIERIACWLKRPSGEEQILIGHPLETDPTPG